MGGSKKGERRGNARKRPDKPEAKRTHESPGEIMRDALRRPRTQTPVIVERRIKISRIILGASGAAEDTTPKEVLLKGMHHNLQAAYDWIDMLEQLSQLPPSPENDLAVERAEREIERLYDKAGELAFKVAGYIHPKLQATHVTGLTGVNQANIIAELLTEIDELEREVPIPIEHKPKAGGG